MIETMRWLTPLLSDVEHANFFETRATEYSKAATRGNWNEVSDSFDSRERANAVNDVIMEPTSDDMFRAAAE